MNMTPQTKKYLVIGGVVIAGLFLYKSVMPKTDTSGQDTDPTQGGGAGYVFNAKNVANSLYQSMRQMGTDQEAVINVLTPVSVKQFDAVIQAFGTKTYNTITRNQYALLWQDLPYLGLRDWLKHELSDKKYNHLALKYPQLK